MLFRKLWRDLIKNKTQFISIFLMSFLGLYIFVGLDAESIGMAVSIDNYFEETNLADLFISGNGFTQAEEELVEEIENVESAYRRLVVEAAGQMDEQPKMQLNFLSDYDSSHMYLKEGVAYTPGSDGIWIEENFAKARKLSVGDMIEIKYNSITITEELKGIVIHPEYIYYSLDSNNIFPAYGTYGYAFLSADAFPIQSELIYNQMLIDVEDTTKLEATRAQIEEVIDRKNIIITDREQNPGCSMIQNEQKQMGVMGYIFSFVFLLIAVLGIVTTMTRMTKNQRMQIGTLKALGFTNRKITIHYVSYGIVISLAGAITGSITGYYTIPAMLTPLMAEYYILPSWDLGLSNMSYVSVILSVMISAGVSFWSCRKELRDMPAITLKPAPPANTKHTALEKSKFWLKLRFSTQWNIRDILRNRARSLMGIVGIAGCSMLLVCAFGCMDSFLGFGDWMYGELITGKNKVTFEENISYHDKREYAQQYAGQLLEEGTCEFALGNIKKKASYTVLGSGNFVHFQDKDGNSIKIPQNGISMSYKMAKTLGINEGDFIKWRIVGEDEWKTSRILAIYRTPVMQGMTMSRAAYEDYEYTFSPTSYYTNKTVPLSLSEDDEILGVADISQMKADMNETMQLMYTMTSILILAAVVLGVIVLYNLGVLSFVEKTREVATLKVLGFSSKSIRGILGEQNMIITILGIIVGIPIGCILLSFIGAMMPEDNDLRVVIHVISFVYSIVGTWLVSVLVNKMLSRKVKTINMVDALKGVE